MALIAKAELRLSGLFSAAAIQLELRSSNREDVLLELVEAIPALARNSEVKEQLHRALLAREGLCCTGLGRGVAVPHTRNCIAAAAGRTLIVFGRHASGIDYGAPDQVPIRLFFLLLAPDIQQHLQTLSRLTRLLRSGELREQLLSAATAAEVIAAIASAETRSSSVAPALV
jgi:mannitol/fructose-specific phosphotransferase system IIA component (Ntr-type)